jgi:hypothetical protein
VLETPPIILLQDKPETLPARSESFEPEIKIMPSDFDVRARSQSDPIKFEHRKKVFERYLEDEEVKVKWVFMPDSLVRLLWDLLLLAFILYSGISVPFRVSFDVKLSTTWQALDYVVSSVFLADIVVNFNTAFYRGGALIDKR